MKLFINLLICCFITSIVEAQELKCTVNLNSQKIDKVDPQTFKTLETSITEFMNQRAWTTDVFSPEERIECGVYITLDGQVAQDVYSGSITIQSSRNAFNSNYPSPILNFKDQDFIFTYAINTPLDFNVNQYQSNLTSVLAFYAYVIIGLDYESMAKGAGAKYFTLAEQITNQVPANASDSKGWKPFDGSAISGNRNRFNIINSLIGSKFDGYKQALYDYHYLGLDKFYDNPTDARASIIGALEKIDKSFRDNPNNVLLNLFLQAKGDELVSIFSGAESSEKAKVVGILKRLDAANGPKYDKIMKG
jgi:hypothetical protein